MAEPAARPVRGLKYYFSKIMIYLFIAYLTAVLLLFLFQRKLIYHPGALEDSAPTAFGWGKDQAREVEAVTADGLKLRGWHVLPTEVQQVGADSAVLERKIDALIEHDGKPVILYFHGNAGTRADRSDLYSKLSKLGAHVIAFDYRGFGGNPGTPSETGLEQDAAAVWKLATEGMKVSPDRIILAGESLGCAVAVRLAQQQCQVRQPPAGLALEAPFTSLGDAGASHFPVFPVRWILLDRFPSLERIGAVNCPILVFHGVQDEVVPFRLGEALFAKAPEKSTLGVEKRFVRLEGVHHNDIRLMGDEIYRREWQEFLKCIRVARAAAELK